MTHEERARSLLRDLDALRWWEPFNLSKLEQDELAMVISRGMAEASNAELERRRAVERDNLRLITEDWQRFSDSAWLREFLASKARWSYDTFGPGARTAGIIAHIRKELEEEIEPNPFDLMEWIDVVMLAVDGFWRAYVAGAEQSWGVSVDEDRTYAADEFIRLLCEKDRINRARTWPAPTSEDELVEHVR